MVVALQYFCTIGQYGLSEVELEEILSCDEEVLNEVYQWKLTPVRRLPIIMLLRIKHQLKHYIGRCQKWQKG